MSEHTLPPEVEKAILAIHPNDYLNNLLAQAAEIERLRVNCVMDCDSCEHRIPPEECYVLVINAQNVADRNRYKAERDWLAERAAMPDFMFGDEVNRTAAEWLKAAEEATRDE